jgi:hypothetical protein
MVSLLAFIALTALLGAVAPRQRGVSGEAISDRAFTLADGRVDAILNTINYLPQVNVSGFPDENDIQAAIIASWEGRLNGYADVPESADNASNLATYFYNTGTETWYAIWNTTDDHLMNVTEDHRFGRQLSAFDDPSGSVLSLELKDLTTNTFVTNGVVGLDPACRTDNQWFEVDTNASYNDTPTDIWTIRASAYMLSKPEVVRTIEAKAEKNIDIDPSKQDLVTDVYNWFTTIDRSRYFSDYVFLDNFDVNFGKYAEINGIVHANGTVNMGGWAKYPVSSTETVTDIAVDDNYRSDGRFSLDKKRLSWAESHGYAIDYADAVPWLQVGKALTGSSPVRKPASDTGMQDKAVDPYYVSGDATIVFSVEGSAGKVTINGTKYSMPSNGIIYVQGQATVKGKVLGSCMLGASGSIQIAGDIAYNTAPRTDENAPATGTSDFLGLVSNSNIVIPYGTYQADKNLSIDAAMVANGWLGINPNDWNWHNLNTNPDTAPTLVVRGALAAGDGRNMFAVTQSDMWGRSQIKGYDLRQYNFDWNLKQVGVPDGFPTTGLGSASTETIVTEASMLKYGIVSSHAEYAALYAQLVDPASHPAASPLTINGRKYYAKKTGTTKTGEVWSGTGLVTNGMYRIGWMEQIAAPVSQP